MFEQCEARNPLAVVYALSVQSFKHYNRLQRRSCVVRVLGNEIMTHAHIAARQLCITVVDCIEHDSVPDWQESPLKPNEDIFVRPETILLSL